jgi:hypothetical protein
MAPTAVAQAISSLEFPNNTNPQWWRDSGLRKLIFWQACILISQMTVGYDEIVVGSFQAMKPWIEGQLPPLETSIFSMWSN